MEMVLTGNMITAAQAERDGLVAKVVPNDKVSKFPARIKCSFHSNFFFVYEYQFVQF